MRQTTYSSLNSIKKTKKNYETLLIEQYQYLVSYIAKKTYRKLPNSVYLDDLISAGNIGLIDAAKKFDKDKNVSFQTYAKYRIKGAILDELRDMDFYSRNMRQKVQDIEKAIAKIEKKEQREAKEEEIAKELNISIETYFDMLNQINNATVLSLEQVLYTSSENDLRLKDKIKDEDKNSPEEKYADKELKSILTEIIKSLPEKDQLLISLYYFEGLKLKDIGKVLNLTESRVSQLHTVLILKLKKKVNFFYNNG